MLRLSPGGRRRRWDLSRGQPEHQLLNLRQTRYFTVTAMRNTTRPLVGATVATLIAQALLQTPARAAEAPAADVLEEVVVTADKRGERSTQDVPAAIQAI